MDGNPHFYADGATADHGRDDALRALAYEQRTANLIALERSQWQAWKDGDLNAEGVHLWNVTASKIAGRLGLE
jgi:hypothetical protein